MTNIGTHRTHCCAIHGCKYAHADCPVQLLQVMQETECQVCDELDPYDNYTTEYVLEFLVDGVWEHAAATTCTEDLMTALKWFFAQREVSKDRVRLVSRVISDWSVAVGVRS